MIGSGTAHILRLNGPAAICHWVWNQQMRSGMEMIDCEKLKAFARPASLKGSPGPIDGIRTAAALERVLVIDGGPGSRQVDLRQRGEAYAQ